MITRLLLASLLAWAWAWVGCEDTSAPKDPVWNKQPCDHCHMLLSEPRFAAQLTDATGQRAYFDDVGCMIEYVGKQAQPPKHLWVRQAESWTSVEDARFAADAKTPMGFGFEARADGTLDYAAVRTAVTTKGKPGAAP
jgi:copper chaperone NosL